MEKYIAFEELEAQQMGLLPDRVEMRRRRRRGRRGGSSAVATAANYNTNVNINDSFNEYEFGNKN
jgi:hypothetical protein